VLQLVLFQLAEEIGFTGFLQDRWQHRYSALRLSAYVAFFWAVWHVPDFFGDEGWGLEQLVAAPIFFVIEFVALFFARALFVWFYDRTGRSVLLVAIFHASFDASISELSYDVVLGSNAARFLIFSAVIVIGAVAVIVATRGRFAQGTASVGTP
jgi:membrane protease YdiL (CAAX protease family)